MIQLPCLYAILDSAFFPTTEELIAYADELVAGGCTLLQYRNKSGNARMMLEQARELRRRLPTQNQNPHFSQNQGEMGHPRTDNSIRLVMNDRADLCLGAEFDGVHVGQEDLSPESVRAIIGPERWLGVSTHNPEQMWEADLSSANYLAIGPVFSTSSKERPDPVVGLEGVGRARARVEGKSCDLPVLSSARARRRRYGANDERPTTNDVLRTTKDAVTGRDPEHTDNAAACRERLGHS
jgi:thiamine-phosphate pyrophosphorylase